jgi:ribosome biogenesis GTPase
VRLEDGRTVHAVLRGRVKRQSRVGDRVVIGDRVEVERVEGSGEDGEWAIEAVLPRASVITRQGHSERRPKVIAANLDRMFAVVAARDPEPRLAQLDRLLVIAEANGIPATVVVNKVDLSSTAEPLERMRTLYEDVGYPVLAVSAESGRGLEELREALSHGTSALIGASGVGKSSLLNALAPSLDLRVGELSRRVRRGRHTTVRSRLLELPFGGLVADTPGFGDVGVWGVPADEVEDCFPEIRALRDECRFRGCAHVKEPGCAVLEAVQSGAIARSRWESYRALRQGDVAD